MFQDNQATCYFPQTANLWPDPLKNIAKNRNVSSQYTSLYEKLGQQACHLHTGMSFKNRYVINTSLFYVQWSRNRQLSGSVWNGIKYITNLHSHRTSHRSLRAKSTASYGRFRFRLAWCKTLLLCGTDSIRPTMSWPCHAFLTAQSRKTNLVPRVLRVLGQLPLDFMGGGA